MKNTKMPRIIKTLNTTLSVFIVITIIFWFIMFIFFLLSLFSVTNSYPLLDIVSKIKVGHFVPGLLHLNGNEYQVYYYEAFAKIEFHKYPKPFSDIASGFLLLILIGGIYIAWCFKKIIVNIRSGEFFIFDNVNLLKKTGYGILTIWLAKAGYGIFFYFYIAKNITFENVNVLWDTDLIHLNSLFFGGAMLVLASIFDYGMRLQKDKDLTI
jgi:hypothetical protein